MLTKDRNTTRFEVPASRWSEVVEGGIVFRELGAHSFDTAWPFLSEEGMAECGQLTRRTQEVRECRE